MQRAAAVSQRGHHHSPRAACTTQRSTRFALLLLVALAPQLAVGAHAAAASTTPPTHEAGGQKLCAPGPYNGAALHSSMTRAPGGSPLKVYHNLALHGGKWYALVAANSSESDLESDLEEGMSLNYGVIKLPVGDAAAFQSNLVKPCYVPGVTLHWDFPFPGYPDNLGHWAELAWPTYGAFHDPAWAEALHQPGQLGAGDKAAEAAAAAEAEAGQRLYVARVLLANIKAHLLDWCRETLALALAPVLPPGSTRSGLPPLVEASALADYGKTRWLLFEHVAVVQDRYPRIQEVPRRVPGNNNSSSSSSGGGSDGSSGDGSSGATAAAAAERTGFAVRDVGFPTPEAARRFREAAYARHWWPLGPAAPPAGRGTQQQQQQQQQQRDGQGKAEVETPHEEGEQGGECSAAQGSCAAGPATRSQPRPPLPRVVTVLLDPDHYPPVTNHAALVEALEEVAGPLGFRVRVVSLTPEAPFVSHLATMAGTGLLLARHGPLLASAVLLPPGAAVLELLPYKWDWRNMSTLYANMTASTGVIHHFAWRPRDAAWCRYAEPADRDQFADWTGGECRGRACLEAHARAGLEVDLAAVRALVAVKLPGILRGDPVAALKEPWPSAED